MTLSVRDTATLRTATEARVLMADGMKPIDKMWFRTASGLSQFYQRGIRLGASPSQLVARSASQRPTTSASVSVFVSGGTPPYTHSWSGASPLTINSPYTDTTTFGVPRAFEGRVTAVDTVSDASGLQASISVDIIVRVASDGGINA